MNGLVRQAEALAASDDKKMISPLMHFAMDYLGISAGWHTSLRHMISCPNCGDQVLEGIAYHKNAFGEKCIIDQERYLRSIQVARPQVNLAEEEDAEEVVVAPQKPKRKKV
jgi:hypothetical protein